MSKVKYLDGLHEPGSRYPLRHGYETRERNMGELNIGSMAIFLGYADRCLDRIERLWPAELVMIASHEGEGCARSFPVDEAGERLPGRDDELVWKEEVLPLPRTGIPRDEFERAKINAQGARRRLADLLKATGSRLFNDIRNRAAFIYVTGMFPTHLRPEALGFLVVMTEPVGDVLPLCGRGPVRLSRYYFDRLLLETHPMVETVREQIANGWEVCAPNGPNQRSSFQRVFIRRGGEQQTVQSDGSILLGWNRKRNA